MTDLERIAKALESIAGSLVKIANPLLVAGTEKIEGLTELVPGLTHTKTAPVMALEVIDARRRATDWREQSAGYIWNSETRDYDPVAQPAEPRGF